MLLGVPKWLMLLRWMYHLVVLLHRWEAKIVPDRQLGGSHLC